MKDIKRNSHLLILFIGIFISNGISEPTELHALSSKGVTRLELDYRESRRTDAHGNRFKFRARVRDAQGAQVGRWAWDVYLVVPTRNDFAEPIFEGKIKSMLSLSGFAGLSAHKPYSKCG